jgi:hypothetical protein
VIQDELAQLRDALDIAEALPESIRGLLLELLEAAKAREDDGNARARAFEPEPAPARAQGTNRALRGRRRRPGGGGDRAFAAKRGRR